MYREFVILYALLGVAILLLLVTIVLLVVLLKKNASGAGRAVVINQPVGGHSHTSNHSTPAADNRMVYCKRCGGQFIAAQRVCPKCGTPR